MNAAEPGKVTGKEGINGVILSPALLTALYAEVLVSLSPSPAVPESRKKPASSVKPQIEFIGANRRKTCLLISLPGKEVLPAKTRNFLEKMLSACQLGIDDLVIVNLRLSPVSAGEIIHRFAPTKWLLAGISPDSIGIPVADTRFEVLVWQENQLLLLPPLAELDQDTASARQLKGQLWTGLQTLFGL